jgi:hypothetical protein
MAAISRITPNRPPQDQGGLHLTEDFRDSGPAFAAKRPPARVGR